MNTMYRAIFAFLLFTFTLPASAQTDARISATWQVQKYDINAVLPQADTDRNLSVKAKIDIRNVSSAAASTLTLRIASSAEVTAVSVNGTTVDFTKGEEKISAANSLQRIVLRIPSVQPNGTISATVDYKLNVKENSGLNALSPVGSQFLPTSFWYPTPNSWYFARGADFAPFGLTISPPGGARVITSGVPRNQLETGSRSIDVFENKLIGQPFFVSGTWDEVTVAPVSVYIPKGSGAEEQRRANELAAIGAEARAFAASLLGTAPEVPIRIVTVKRGGGFSGGGTVFVDDAVLRRSKIDSQTAMNIADAMAKLWLGNAVAVNGDGFGVIREGLAKYIATQFIENKYGKDVADVERLRQRTAYAAVALRDSPLNIASPLDDYYYPEVANKGAMIWRLMAKKVGPDAMFGSIRDAMRDGNLTLSEFRAANSTHKEFLDFMFDQVTEMNLQAGLPQTTGGESKINLRNTGAVDATVNVTALFAGGEKMTAPTTVRAKSYGEVIFKTAGKINRIEIDPEKLYPQTVYSDDVAPRELTDNDMLLAVKRSFDKQEYAAAEATARTVLREVPRFDDVRVLLGRSLLAQNKNAEAEKEFRAILDEKLPTSRSLAWANVGLGEIASKSGQAAQAVKFAEEAIRADAEYGASLAARAIRNRSNAPSSADESVKAFFAQFDKAAISNRKAELEIMAVAGDASKFTSGITGQAVEWNTQVLHVDTIDANSVLVETKLAIKLLNREPEAGTAVFRLTKMGAAWKMSGVDIFEVR